MHVTPNASRSHGSTGSQDAMRSSNPYSSLVYPPSPEQPTPRDEVPLILQRDESFNSMDADLSYFDKRRRGRQWEDRCSGDDRPSVASTPVTVVPPPTISTKPELAPNLNLIDFGEAPIQHPETPGSPDSIAVSPFTVPTPKLGIRKRPTFLRNMPSIKGVIARAPSNDDPLVQENRPALQLRRKVAFEENAVKPIRGVPVIPEAPHAQLPEQNPYFPDMDTSQEQNESSQSQPTKVKAVRRVRSLFIIPARFKRKRTDSADESAVIPGAESQHNRDPITRVPRMFASEADIKDAAKLISAVKNSYVTDPMDRQRATSPMDERSNPFESLDAHFRAPTSPSPRRTQIPLHTMPSTISLGLSTSLPSRPHEDTGEDHPRQGSDPTELSSNPSIHRVGRFIRRTLSRSSLPSLVISRPARRGDVSRESDSSESPMLANASLPAQVTHSFSHSLRLTRSPVEQPSPPPPSFLTSEAHRLNTLPLGRTQQGTLRSHFFDLNLPKNGDPPQPTLSLPARVFPMPRKTILSLAEVGGRDDAIDDQNWYRVRMDEGKSGGGTRLETGMGAEGLTALRE